MVPSRAPGDDSAKAKWSSRVPILSFKIEVLVLCTISLAR
jgi:hypothetical protein